MIRFDDSKSDESWTTQASIEVGGTCTGRTIVFVYGQADRKENRNIMDQVKDMRKVVAERNERNKTALRKGKRKYADSE